MIVENVEKIKHLFDLFETIMIFSNPVFERDKQIPNVTPHIYLLRDVTEYTRT